MTAPAEPARAITDIRAWLTAAAASVHAKTGRLRWQYARQIADHAVPAWQASATRLELDQTTTVETWLARQLRELPGGER